MPGFDAERSYTVYEDHKGFYVKKQNPDNTWQKAYIQQSHLEAFFDRGQQAQIPVDVDEDKYQDEEDLPEDGNYATLDDIAKKRTDPADGQDTDQPENLIKVDFDGLQLSDLDTGPPTETKEKHEAEEDDITRYRKKGVLPKIDARRHYQPKGSDVKIFTEKPKWQSEPKIDFRKDYKPGGGNVEIVNERLKWDTGAKVDSKRPHYKPKGGNVNIVDEKVSWKAEPRIEANNARYNPKASNVEIISQRLEWKAAPKVEAKSDHKPGGGKVDIINEKLKWDVTAKVGSVTSHVPGGGHVEIPHEKLQWNVVPRIDARQKDYKPGGGDVEIVSAKIHWDSQQKIDAHNKDYQPGGGDVTIIDSPVKVRKESRTESVNPNYERPTGKAQIVNEVLNWDARPKIDAIQEHYKPGGGREVQIVDEKLIWDSKPKVEALKSNYKPEVRDVNIFTEKPKWNAIPKIDSQNKDYTKPERKDFRIINQKGYDWDKEKPLRKMNSLQNIRWLPVVENVTFDPIKRRWVAAAKMEPPEIEDKQPPDTQESEATATPLLCNETEPLTSPSASGSDFNDTTTETSSIKSSQTNRSKKKVKRRQTMPDMSDKVTEFLYNQKVNDRGYASLMRERRKDMPIPEDVKWTLRELKEAEYRQQEVNKAYSKADKKDTKVKKGKPSKSANMEVLDMASLYRESKGK